MLIVSYINTLCQAFSAERASWRAVIQLNVVRSIHIILDAITQPSHSRPRKEGTSNSSSPMSGDIPLPGDLSEIDLELLEIRSRLSPLLQVEDLLTRHLTPIDQNEVGTIALLPFKHIPTELAVNSTVPWRQRFDRLVSGKNSDSARIIDWDDPNDPGKVLHAVRAPVFSLALCQSG